MGFELPSADTEYGERVRRRLTGEMIAWLTTVDAAGQPQPSPVWFLWDDDTATALVYCQPGARRVTNLPGLDRASLHLNDPTGHDVVVLSGSIALAPDVGPAEHNAAYTAKYGGWIEQVFGTAETFSSSFAVPVTFTPRRVRGT